MLAPARGGYRKHFSGFRLRHRYATHLLESVTDLRYIQELPGHNSGETTGIYTPISTKSLQQIKVRLMIRNDFFIYLSIE
jgi:site-specific recombinase XerD